MNVIRLEQLTYIKIALLQGRNARECYSGLVGALRNSALPTSSQWHYLVLLPYSTAILMWARCSRHIISVLHDA